MGIPRSPGIKRTDISEDITECSRENINYSDMSKGLNQKKFPLFKYDCNTPKNSGFFSCIFLCYIFTGTYMKFSSKKFF